MNLQDLNKAISDRLAEETDIQYSLSFFGNEMAGEVGEACNVIKKLEREALGAKGSRATVDDLGKELGDVIICAAIVAYKVGIDLSVYTRNKFNETSDKRGMRTKI